VKSRNFYLLKKYQQIALLNRLRELVNKLEQLKPGFAATVTATSLAMLLATGASAQTFVRDSTDNALKGATYPYVAGGLPLLEGIPAFADLDNDGDKDCVIGNVNYSYTGAHSFLYYKNTGTASAPAFTAQLNGNDPFNAITDPNSLPTLAIADLDGDGDFDILSETYSYNSSTYTGTFYLAVIKNTGTKTNPVFAAPVTANALFSSGTAPTYNGMTPALVDIDGDGDLDLFFGEAYGSVYYFKNTGSASAPVFSSGFTSPLPSTLNVGGVAAPSFADVDNDGDYDALIGSEYNAQISFFRNTGTATNPVFTAETGGNDPFSVIDTYQTFIMPAFVDIDGDGDEDLFVGDKSPTAAPNKTFSIEYYRNNEVVTGTTSAVSASDLNVYPNPAKDVLTISLGNQTGTFPLSVVNATGMEVKNTTINAPSTTLNVADLNPGIYMLKIGITAAKFVKQ